MLVFFLSMLGFGKSLFGAVAQWLSRRSLAEIVCIALGLALALDHLALLMSHRHARKVETQLSKTAAAYAQTVANYRAAALRAQQADAANKARAEKEQAAISGRIASDYQDRVAAARAEYQRLLANATAHSGVRPGANVPVIPPSSGSPAQAAGKDGLSDALTATEQAIQLDELIKWVNAQHQVDPNGKQ